MNLNIELNSIALLRIVIIISYLVIIISYL